MLISDWKTMWISREMMKSGWVALGKAEGGFLFVQLGDFCGCEGKIPALMADLT